MSHLSPKAHTTSHDDVPCVPSHLPACLYDACQCLVQAEMQEVVREQKESNERLKVHTEEFNVLLAKNNTSA